MARKLITISVAVTGALIAASPASAVTVTTCEGLQPALSDESNSVVTIAEGMTCEGDFYLPSRPITLEGAGTGATLSGDEELRERILYGSDVGKTVIRNLRFMHGSDEEDGDGGGAILVEGDSPITVEDSTFEDNSAEGDGGAILVNPFSGGVESAERSRGAGETPRVTIRRSTFGGGDGLENSSDANGGAVAAYLFAIDVIDSKFAGNRAQSRGGGLAASSFDTVTLTGNAFTDNVSRGEGGGAAIGACDAVVSGNTFSGNVVEGGFRNVLQREVGDFGGHAEGGGLWASGSCAVTVDARTAALGAQDLPALEQTGNTFRANALDVGTQGTGRGGGEYVTEFALRSTGDVFHANEIAGSGAGGWGAGLNVDAWDGEPAVGRNLVATANRMPDGDGGAINYSTDVSGGGTLQLTHATLAANDAGAGQGGALDGGSADSLVLHNSIVHGNAGDEEISGFEAPEPGALRGETVSGSREIRSTLACDGAAPFEGEGNLCADPKLANAAAGDVHQTAASPTVDKASAALTDGLTTDYEGDARAIAAGPDMGADEAPAPAPQQQPQQPAAPPSGGVLGTQARSCVSRRSFTIRLRNRGQKVRKATVLVNGKRVKVLRGKRLTTRVNLRGLPKGRFTVKIVLRLASGKTISGTRRYRTCTPGRQSGPPPV